eukprot:SAG31_NODE_799_length_12017_cov_5.478436_2_plen_109_part_00
MLRAWGSAAYMLQVRCRLLNRANASDGRIAAASGTDAHTVLSTAANSNDTIDFARHQLGAQACRTSRSIIGGYMGVAQLIRLVSATAAAGATLQQRVRSHHHSSLTTR